MHIGKCTHSLVAKLARGVCWKMSAHAARTMACVSTRNKQLLRTPKKCGPSTQ